MTCIGVTLNGHVFDGVTPDADGIVWSWQDLTGWFDSTKPRVEHAERGGPGEVITVARLNGRPISMQALASARSAGQPLGNLVYKAMRTLKRDCDLIDTAGLLTVAEPGLSLQAYVQTTDAIQCRVLQPNYMVQFLIPLLAPDPRRYASTPTTDSSLQLTSSATTTTHTVSNNGDLPTPAVFTVDAPCTHVLLGNNTTGKSIHWNGTLAGGDVLVVDTGRMTVELNGNDSRDLLDVAHWFDIAPGTNSLVFSRAGGSGTSTAALSFRDAYS